MTKTDKKCPHCGAPLAQDASFCPHCTATLAQRRVIALPRAGHRRSRWLLLAAVIAAAAAAVVLWLSRPGGTPPEDTAGKEDAAQAAADPYLAACQTYYTGADGREYHVFTAVTPSIEGRTDPVGYRSELIPAGGTVDFPATVMVEDAVTQDYAAEDFAALLDSWDVSVTAPEGVSRVKLWDAEEETPESPALLYRRLRADPTCTHNEVVWTLRMKSGDVLHLTMTVEFEEQTTLYFGRQDAPLETAQELQALLDDIAGACDADTSVTVYLPEVTYDAPITVGCAVELVGSGTTFTAPITVAPLKNTDLTRAFVRFRQINFTGDGSGTGITAAAPTYLEESRVTGWAVGGEAVTGGWLYLRGSHVADCGVGIRYNSAYSSSYTYFADKMTFVQNGTALELLCLPPNSYAALDDCRFRGNGTDVYNPGGYRIEVNNGTEVALPAGRDAAA